MNVTDLAGITTQVYALLSPLDPDGRARVIAACLALFGDPVPAGVGSRSNLSHVGEESLPEHVGAKARRWIRQFDLTADDLEQVFHFTDTGSVELIATEIPGATKKEQSANAYLLCGAASFLATDEPKIDNSVAVQFAKHVGCYDKNNHTANRNSLGNRISGSIESGFLLPAPGLKAAALLVKGMATS